MADTIRREIRFSQSREEVWRALTDRARLAEWMYPNDFAPDIGHRFTFNVPPNPKANFDGTVECEVLKCVPSSELAYSWVACGHGGTIDTRVSYRLERDSQGTRITFEHSEFENRQAFQGAEHAGR
jgi:uncharacterized protein YndB with AHSA1/START domain